MTSTCVPAAQLEEFYARCMEALGLPTVDAATVARVLVDADLAGIDTHGAARLPAYVDRIRGGATSPTTRVTVIRDQGPVGVLDAGNGVGQVAASAAMDDAITRARRYGIGVVGVRRSNHLGALSYYAKLAMEYDMIGIAMSGVSPSLAPWGGRQALVGSNPWAVAIPCRNRAPLVVDLANGVIITDTIRAAVADGSLLPPDAALDADGNPTRDAVAAQAGSILPIGGHKGSALAIVLEVLASVLTGASYSDDIAGYHDVRKPKDVGHLLIALAVEAFMPYDGFIARVEDFLERLATSSPRAQSDAVRLPGERADRCAAERRIAGVPLPSGVERQLRRIAEELDVEFVA